MKHTNIKCSSCNDCPFLFAIRFPFSSFCTLAEYKELDQSNIDVHEEMDYEEIKTPRWCPLKSESVTVKLKE